MQSDLGLRSTWFQVGILALKPQPAPVAAGTAVTLTGTVEGLSGVALEAEAKGGPWRTVAPVVPDSAGSFSVAVTPRGHDPLPARDGQRPGRADQGRGGHALSRARRGMPSHTVCVRP